MSMSVRQLMFLFVSLQVGCVFASSPVITLPADRFLHANDYALTNAADPVWVHEGPLPASIANSNKALLAGTNHCHQTGWRFLNCRMGCAAYLGWAIPPIAPATVPVYPVIASNLAVNLRNDLGARVESPVFTNGIGTLYFEAINNLQTYTSQITVELATNMVNVGTGEIVPTVTPPSTNGLVPVWVPVDELPLAATASNAFTRYNRCLDIRNPVKVRIRRSGTVYAAVSLDSALTVVDNIRVSFSPADVTVTDVSAQSIDGIYRVRCFVSNADANQPATNRTVTAYYRWLNLAPPENALTNAAMALLDAGDGCGNGERYEATLPPQRFGGELVFYVTCVFDGYWYQTPDYTGLGYTNYPTENRSPFTASVQTQLLAGADLYILTVHSGSGSGSYTNGQHVAVMATNVVGMAFAGWTGATQHVDIVTSPNVTVSMPNFAIALTATYTNAYYTLTVTNGTGGGAYTNGQVVPIVADAPPPGMIFHRWTGDTATVASLTSPSTTMTIPGAAAAVTATYVEVFTLTVSNGSGGGSYTNGQRVAITADAPPPGMIFHRWTGDTATVASLTSPSTTMTIPGAAAAVTATYVEVFTLTVSNGSGGGAYTNGQKVAISADALTGMAFARWVGATQYLASAVIASTTVTMPDFDITLTATYTNVYFTLTVVNGTGGGAYTNGQVVTIVADAPPPGKSFRLWKGSAQYVADVFSANTTVTMPARSISVTAFYPTVYYVNAARPNDTGVGTSWETAKKTIQAAVNVSADYDTVLVTNGVYNVGTTLVQGHALSNRVVITKDITVRSVGGPSWTFIEGAGTNRYDTSSAVRCVYMHHGTLEGFTLRYGATFGLIPGTNYAFEISGGGVCYAYSSAAETTVTNCIITNCVADWGGGAFGGRLIDCSMTDNSAASGGGAACSTLSRCVLSRNSSFNGGGSEDCTLENCTLVENLSKYRGGGSKDCTLINCTLYKNMATTSGGGSYGDTLTNCIVWDNTKSGGTTDNYSGSTFRFSCTSPLPTGNGNIAENPLFVSTNDRRLSAASPCIDRGSNSDAPGTTDLAGYLRILNGTVDMGAYEHESTVRLDFSPFSGTCFTNALEVTITCATAGVVIRYTLDGRTPTEEDTLYESPLMLTNSETVTARSFGPGIISSDARATYHLLTTYYVDASRPDDSGAGTSWGTAKKTIQAAVNLTDAGDTVLVTNGVYNSGTTPTPGYTLNNRVVITNAITVRSVGGPRVTIIEGSGANLYDTASAVRCVFMTNGILDGFTLRNGATYGSGRGSSDLYERSGGGVNLYGASTGTTVSNCVILSCRASAGGGSYYGTLNNCTLTGNSASTGGGSFNGTLNCCTLSGNAAYSVGGGVYYGTLNNCIVWSNTKDGGTADDHYGCTFRYSCSVPLPAGAGNINEDPQFLGHSDLRLRDTSPCIDKGQNAIAVGVTDLAGNPRIQNGTVDMGAYEGGYQATAWPIFSPPSGTRFTNSLAVAITCATEGAAIRYTLDGRMPTEEDTLYVSPLIFTSAVTVSACTFKPGMLKSDDLATYRPALHFVDASRPDDSGAGTTWVTAKKTIQAAIDLAEAGETVLVADGVYNSGAAPTPGFTLNNRVVISRDITVRSVHGPGVTVIEGSGTNFYDTALALRCVYMSRGTLEGFTLRNGATYGSGCGSSDVYERFGGGVNMFNSASNTVVRNCSIVNCLAYRGGGTFTGTVCNCVLTGNAAYNSGGGVYLGTLNNCTLSGNRVRSISNSGGGVNGGYLYNCIVWGNTKVGGSTDNYSGSTLSYSCSTNLPTGSGNIAANPLFVGENDLRLSTNSPCIDKGTNYYALGTTDMGSNPRILNYRVDMGAYEHNVIDAPVPVPFVWLDQYPVLLSMADGNYLVAANSDADGDGYTAWQEYVAGTVPTNHESVLRAYISISNSLPLIYWTPDLGTTRVYLVEGKTNLAGSVWCPTNRDSRFFRVRADMP